MAHTRASLASLMTVMRASPPSSAVLSFGDLQVVPQFETSCFHRMQRCDFPRQSMYGAVYLTTFGSSYGSMLVNIPQLHAITYHNYIDCLGSDITPGRLKTSK